MTLSLNESFPDFWSYSHFFSKHHIGRVTRLFCSQVLLWSSKIIDLWRCSAFSMIAFVLHFIRSRVIVFDVFVFVYHSVSFGIPELIGDILFGVIIATLIFPLSSYPTNIRILQPTLGRVLSFSCVDSIEIVFDFQLKSFFLSFVLMWMSDCFLVCPSLRCV